MPHLHHTFIGLRAGIGCTYFLIGQRWSEGGREREREVRLLYVHERYVLKVMDRFQDALYMEIRFTDD